MITRTLIASVMVIRPPIEVPTKTARSMPRSRASLITSPA